MYPNISIFTYPLLCGLLLEALVKLELEIRAAAVFNLFRSTAVKGTHFKIFMVVSVIVTHFLSHRRTWKMEKLYLTDLITGCFSVKMGNPWKNPIIFPFFRFVDGKENGWQLQTQPWKSWNGFLWLPWIGKDWKLLQL